MPGEQRLHDRALDADPTTVDQPHLDESAGVGGFQIVRDDRGNVARRDLEAFVRRAPEPCRAAFDFKLTPDAVVSFNDRQILLRADRD